MVWDVFQNKDVNNVAKIGNYNISTKDFISHINQTGLNPEIIGKNIDKDILKDYSMIYWQENLLN